MAEARKRYRVIGSYVTFKTATPDGIQIRGLHQGAPVPEDATEEAIQHHLSVGLIEEIPNGRRNDPPPLEETPPPAAEADASAEELGAKSERRQARAARTPE